MVCRHELHRPPAPVPRERWIRGLSLAMAGYFASALIASGCVATAPVNPPAPPPLIVAVPPPANNPPPPPQPREIVARASWYGPGFDGHKTATGERFSSSKMTAAAKDLPMGSRVLVTNLKNGRSALVRINDCGPFKAGRKIDLSKRAASKLGLIHDGTARVKLKVLKKPAGAPSCES
jgi:3D (Asp-Asp-Asp) domain-containing protein